MAEGLPASRSLGPVLIEPPTMRIEIEGRIIRNPRTRERDLVAEATHTVVGSQEDKTYHWVDAAAVDDTASDYLVNAILACLGQAVAVRIRNSLEPDHIIGADIGRAGA